ncbi:MAG: DUF2927 domain-containing protein [Paracoccaceae bacterium]
MVRTIVGAAMISGLVLVAGCAGGRSTDYYDALESTLRLTGNLRTETAPPDASYDAADLVRNFERVALYSEADVTQPGGEDNRETRPLRRWGGPINYSLFGSAVTPEDRVEVAGLMQRIARLTGLEVAESEDDVNFMILITRPDERDVVSGELALADPVLSETFDTWRHSPELVCFGAIFRADEEDYRIVGAMISIGSETRDLIRRACLHEEIVQSLGLANDHPDVRPSIFNDDQEFALLTEHDENLLRILYDPRLAPGMTGAEAMPIVERIAAGIAIDPPAAAGADRAQKPASDSGT